MNKTADFGLLVLRLASGGFLFVGHGLGKVQRLLEGRTDWADPIGIGPLPSLVLAAFAESVCALAVAVGFKTRWAAVPPLITMLVAAFIAQAGEPFAELEKALLFAAAFLTLICTGGGRYAFDALLSRRRASRRQSVKLR